MKYCIDFYPNSHSLDEVDEINVNYDKTEDLIALLDFCNEHKTQRINVFFNDLEKSLNDNRVKDVLDFQKEHIELQIYIRFPDRNQELDEMLKVYNKSKFYFNIYANDWDKALGLINYGVSDIFVVEGLGFEIDKIAAIAHEHNVQIRVFPNTAQSSWKETDDLRKFWIRPEDLSYYEDYIDVCEFFIDREKQGVLLHIYRDDKKWYGDLKEIISGLEDKIDSRYLNPRFVRQRIQCGRSCMKGGLCQMCDRIKNLSQTLEKAGIRIVEDNYPDNPQEGELEYGEGSISKDWNPKEDIE